MKAVRTRASLAIFAVALLAVGCGKEGTAWVDAGGEPRGRAYARAHRGNRAEPLGRRRRRPRHQSACAWLAARSA